MGNFMRYNNMLISGNRDFRKIAMNVVIKNNTIDTCYCPDTQTWETGIKRNDKWIIVEEYLDEATAIKGHNKWTNKITKNTKIKLQECRDGMDWFLG